MLRWRVVLGPAQSAPFVWLPARPTPTSCSVSPALCARVLCTSHPRGRSTVVDPRSNVHLLNGCCVLCAYGCVPQHTQLSATTSWLLCLRLEASAHEQTASMDHWARSPRFGRARNAWTWTLQRASAPHCWQHSPQRSSPRRPTKLHAQGRFPTMHLPGAPWFVMAHTTALDLTMLLLLLLLLKSACAGVLICIPALPVV
jgi:hypothetical protein